MASLPTVTASEALRAFQTAGFRHVRTRGSHLILKKQGHRFNLSIPDHGSANLKPGLLLNQIKKAGLTVEEFIALLCPAVLSLLSGHRITPRSENLLQDVIGKMSDELMQKIDDEAPGGIVKRNLAPLICPLSRN